MPLTAEYTWSESEKAIQLQVPLKGQAKSKVDLFATECYLKISFVPYLLELDLYGCIDSTQPKARFENGTLVIKAKKKEGSFGIWGSLGQLVDRKCDPKVRARREKSIQEKFKQEQELKERVSLRKHHDERLALRSQMNVEETERRQIEEIKAEQKEKAEAEIYRAFAELAAEKNRGDSSIRGQTAPVAQPKQASGEQQGKLLLPNSAFTVVEGKPSGPAETNIGDAFTEEEHSLPAASAAADAKVTGAFIWDEASSADGSGGKYRKNEEEGDNTEEAGTGALQQECAPRNETSESHLDNGDDSGAVSYVPPPRVPVGVLPIGFTTRLFPTPLRESKVADESAWIMKNRKHLHKNKSLAGRLPQLEGTGGDDQHIDISESDPVWLKGKGDDFYRGGDFRGAINAYTAALEADPKVASCLSNRAACHLRLGQTSACVADCGAALEILQALPASGPSQARAFARRSLAYRELGHYRLSLEDCRAALAFNPGAAALEEEIARAEPLALCEASKKEAVARFALGDIASACELYTTALAAVPAFPSCLSNRAACHLALGRPQECVRDCTAVLEILAADPSRKLQDNGSTDSERQVQGLETPLPKPPPGSVPPAGSEKRQKWVLATMLRRGRANVELGHLQGALRDYKAAGSLVPGDKAVEADVRELERLVKEAEPPLKH